MIAAVLRRVEGVSRWGVGRGSRVGLLAKIERLRETNTTASGVIRRNVRFKMDEKYIVQVITSNTLNLIGCLFSHCTWTLLKNKTV